MTTDTQLDTLAHQLRIPSRYLPAPAGCAWRVDRVATASGPQYAIISDADEIGTLLGLTPAAAEAALRRIAR